LGYVEPLTKAKGVPYVVSGYRAPGKAPHSYYRHDTLFKCWRSVWCYWHNETINIHTHLWGAVTAMFVLALQLADVLGLLPPGPWPILSMQQAPEPDLLVQYTQLPLRMSREREISQPMGVDVAMLSVFLVATMVCLGCSATYHTVSCHSREVARWSNRLD